MQHSDVALIRSLRVHGGVGLIFRSFMLALGFLAAARAVAQPLSTAREVRSLSVVQAQQAREVSLRGTVIFAEPLTVYVQDDTAGTFLRFAQPHELRPGDEVDVTGTSRSGLYLPGVTVKQVRILRRGQSLDAPPAAYDELLSGQLHYQRVRIEGVVRTVSALEEGRTLLRLAVGSRVMEARIEAGPVGSRWVGANVQVKGLVAGIINDRRQLVQPYLRVIDWTDVEVITPAARDEDVAAISAETLLAFDGSGQLGKRVRVQGVVTAAFPDGDLFLTDGTAAFRARLSTPELLAVGTEVEVLGFAEMGKVSATVRDGIVVGRKSGTPAAAMELSDLGLLRSGHDSNLVSVDATVVDSFRTDAGVVTLVIQDGARTVHATIPPPSVALENGTRIRLRGICQVEAAIGTRSYNAQVEAVTLRARSVDDVTILRAPSWWTVRRLVIVLAVLSAGTLLCMLWITVLHRQVARQTTALRERIRSEAALEERHRIAREFHDSLEQELAGMRLRLDALATREIDAKGREIVGGTQSLLSRIQAETHNLISDLRDAAETAGDLAAALHALVQSHQAGGSLVQITTDIASPVPPLPESTVHHLRMIAREAINNALKHAGAKRIIVRLEVQAAELVLSIIDDGGGFDPGLTTSGRPGRFGCMGMKERADRIGAQTHWRTAPGAGCAVEVRVPVSELVHHVPGPTNRPGLAPEPTTDTVRVT